MPSERAVSNLIGFIYDAAADSSRWPIFLEHLGQVLRATASNIFVQNLRSQEFIVATGLGVDASFHRSYESYYKDKNVYLIGGNDRLRTGTVYPSHALCPDAVALRSEFYNDWIVPQRHRHGLLGVIYRRRSLAGMLGAIRARGTRPFGREEVSLVEILMPHLQRAVSLQRKIAELEKEKSAARDALHEWPLGVILLDSHSRVLFMNRAAERIAARKDGLTAAAHGIHAALPSETTALRLLIEDAVSTRMGKGGSSGGAITLSRPSFKPALHALVSPLFTQTALPAPRSAVVALFVSDPAACEGLDPTVLRSLYGLTTAEASLACELVSGDGLKEAAEALHVSMNTARTHLKKIFEKTETKSQATLMRLVLKGPSQIPRRD